MGLDQTRPNKKCNSLAYLGMDFEFGSTKIGEKKR